VCGGIGTIPAKTNNPKPEPVGSGQNHCENIPTTRVLCDSIIFYKTTKIK